MEALIGALEFQNVFALDRGLLNGDQELYIIEDNQLVLRKVEVRHFTDAYAIISGLEEGTAVVAQPIIGAYQGMEVAPSLLSTK